MRGKELVDKARKAKRDFGATCPKKFAGAAAIEILRSALNEEGIVTSPRDVFVRGLPMEVDLIVPFKDEDPVLGLLYEPKQVAVALEVKKSGTFGKSALDKIRLDFSQLSKAGIRCAYVTFEERQSYRWKATSDNLGFPCFTLAWHKNINSPLQPTQEWEHLVRFLREGLGGQVLKKGQC